MVTADSTEPNQVGTVAGDGPGTTLDRVTPPEPPSAPKPWPWLLGGVGIGLAVGLLSAGYVTATREFFRAPGWGWAIADVAAQSLLRAR